MLPKPLEIVRIRGEQIALVGGNHHGPVAQVHAVVFKLCADGVKVRHRVPVLRAGYIHHVDQKPATVNVPQEVMAQTCTFCRPFNDAGDVRHDEGHPFLHVNDTQVGVEGGEVVVGDFGAGVGGDGKQGRLAHVGEAHKSHIRQKL